MKPIRSIIALLLLLPVISVAQNPVQWNFSAEKIRSNQYRVNLTARIQSGYHIFSVTQPEDAIVLPTKITVNANTDIDEIGAFKENGMMEKVRDSVLEIEAWQFSEKVEFSGVVTLKSSRPKTILSGQVEFQVCSSDKCYPPTKVSFSVPLNH